MPGSAPCALGLAPTEMDELQAGAVANYGGTVAAIGVNKTVV
jgi:hypothetical protein